MIFAALTALLALGGCTADEPAGTTPPRDTATVAFGVDITGINELIQPPAAINTAISHFALFLPLAEEQADYQDGPPTFLPRLAESWTAAEDRLSITFTLRDDVFWSDGVKTTAEDVRFTWEAQTHADVAWPFAATKSRIRDVEVVDPRTVIFHFTEIYPLQLFEAVQGVVLPKHAWSEIPFEQWREKADWFNDNPVTNGPFTFESWQPQQRFILERYDRYFEPDLPKLERVIFEIVPDTSQQLSLLRAGRADFIELVPYADAKAMDERPDVYLTSYIPRNYFFIGWNLQRGFFGDVAVRQALTLGIDRQALIDSLFYGYGKTSFGPIPSDVWAHHDGLEPWPYDPEKARQMLADSGFADADGDGILERGGEPLRFELITNSDNTLRRDIMVMVQSQLRQIGVDVETRTMEFNALIAPLSAYDFDAVVMGLSIGTDLDLSYNFHTRGTPANGGLNWGRFSDPRTDELIDAVNAEGAALSTKPLLYELQERLHEQQPLTFLYEGERISGVRKPLAGISPNSTSTFANLRHWYFE
ncbi:MAG: ABC transporter substrate-binding protein [Acidobacteriota bacterium]